MIAEHIAIVRNEVLRVQDAPTVTEVTERGQ
jgi:hypothetical protein